MRWSYAVVALCAALLWPVGAEAQTVEQLKQELEAQKRQTADLENRINQLEARQKLKERSLNQKIEEVAAHAEQEKPAAGRTGSKGHVLRLAYQVFKNAQLALTYFDNELVDREPDRDYRRLQADLKLEF